MDNLIDKHVNGAILLGSIFEQNICKIAIERRYSSFPFVTVNANLALPNVREVMLDQVQGTRDAVKLLYKQGRRKIGWIYCDKSPSDKRKHSGFMAGMRECGLHADYLLGVEVKNLEEGKRATAQLLGRSPEVDAIIYSSDMLAVGGARYLNERKTAIPDEIALIGFNNSNCAKECYPPLTSIDNEIYESGKLAAQLMLNMLNKEPAENIQLACGLEIRSST